MFNSNTPKITYLDLKQAPFNQLCTYRNNQYVVRMVIEKQDVQQGNIEKYLEMIDQLEQSKSPMHNTLALIFNDYPLSYQELNQIPEVRDWVYKLMLEKPYLLFYFSDFADSLKLGYLSINDIENCLNLNQMMLDMNVLCALKYGSDKSVKKKILRKIEMKIRKSVMEIFQ